MPEGQKGPEGKQARGPEGQNARKTECQRAKKAERQRARGLEARGTEGRGTPDMNVQKDAHDVNTQVIAVTNSQRVTAVTTFACDYGNRA